MGALFLLHLLILSFYLAAGSGRVVERSSQSDQDSDILQHSSDLLSDSVVRDQFAQHMVKLYEQYNRQHRLKEGNTVRGVNAIQGSGDQKMLFHLNLTSLQDSELVLSATFHFLFDHHPRHKPWHCKRLRRPSCRTLPVHPLPSINLLFHSVSSGSPLLGNVTFHPHRRGVWQMKDVTQVIKEARHNGHRFLSVELDLGQQYQRQPGEALSIGSLPYMLLYADDQVLAEPNSVVASLQRYDPFAEEGQTSRSTLPYSANDSPEIKGRMTREAPLLFDPIQNNELPEVDNRPSRYSKDSLWESIWHLALKPKSNMLNMGYKKTQGGMSEVKGRGVHSKEEPQALNEENISTQTLHSDETTVMKSSDKDMRPPAARDGLSAGRKHQGKDRRKHKARAGGSIPESPVLSFDERTLRKARRRQWGDAQHGGCTRQNLRVDFADIGWSEWVLAPKAFEAYYCAGTCGFPMAKVARPSNHATIQSIVRAVGIIPGVPEPCCVPEKMSPLAVLYHEETRNLVLKVYPNMSVQSCSCR